MIYDDGTMDVQIGNRIEKRPIKLIVKRDLLNTLGWEEDINCGAEPLLYDGEEAIYCVGSDIPQIIKVRSTR